VIVKSLREVMGTNFEVDNTKSVSRRLVVAADNRGYTVTDTYIRPNTTSRMRYDRHVESCYCIEGSGTVRTEEGEWRIEAGTLYSPDQHEEHWLTTTQGMRLICVFRPALRGDENHAFDSSAPSGY
jgi:L-ectoine synthase